MKIFVAPLKKSEKSFRQILKIMNYNLFRWLLPPQRGGGVPIPANRLASPSEG